VAEELPVVAFPSRAEWKAWLSEAHESSPGVWLKFAKKASGIESVYYPEALEVALMYGWIDGQTSKVDDDYYLQRFTPRTDRSKWSKINCEKAEQLIADGSMRAAGLQAVEAARADGRWDAAYDSPKTATVPEDLQRELDRNERAREFFATLDSQNRYAILYRIQDCKRPETRARRIARFVAMLEAGKKVHG
jgi:uncharacterized protein YdeI (YjbR/CyaY-like superfamily)